MTIELINLLINTVIIEVLVLVYSCILYYFFLDIPRNKMKYWAIVEGIKLVLINTYISYIKYIGVFGNKQEMVIIIINTTSAFIVMAVSLVLSEKDLLKCLLLNLIFELSGMVIIILPIIAFSAFLNFDGTVWNGNGVVINGILIYLMEIIVAVIFLYITYIIAKRYGSKFAKWDIKHRKIFWIFSFCWYLYGSFTHIFQSKNNIMGGTTLTIVDLSFLLICALCLYEISLWVRKNKQRQIQQENYILSIENAVMREYYETLGYQLERTRKFRHDIDKHMTVIKEMMLREDNDSGIIDYTSNVQREFENLRQIEYCKNLVVNAILVNKERQCAEQEVEFDIDIARLELGNIKEIDLIAVLANVLDNAIEECGRIESQEKHIELKCDVYAKNLVIKVRNSTDKTEINRAKIDTQKKDKYAHGVGLSIVKEVVEKYDGTLGISVDGEKFEVVIMMKLYV